MMLDYKEQSRVGKIRRALVLCAYPALKDEWRRKNNAYLKYLFLHIYIFDINLDLQQYGAPKVESRRKNNVYLKYLYIYIYIFDINLDLQQ